MQLADQLRAKGIAIGGVDVVAQAGWRTDDLQAALEGKAQGDQPKPQGWAAAFLMAAPKGSLLQKEYDVVALQIGGSDRMEGKSVEQYGADFEALLKVRPFLRIFVDSGGPNMSDTSKVVVLRRGWWGTMYPLPLLHSLCQCMFDSVFFTHECHRPSFPLLFEVTLPFRIQVRCLTSEGGGV